MARGNKMLVAAKPRFKPKMRVSARVEAYPEPLGYDDSKYLREDIKRCQMKVKKLRQELKDFDPKAVASQAKASLRHQLEEELLEVEMAKLRLKKRGKKSAARGGIAEDIAEEM